MPPPLGGWAVGSGGGQEGGFSRAAGAWRGLLAITATYVAFLLFAQFGFLSQVQRDLADAGLVRAVMAAMGIGGLAASLATAWLLGRAAAPRLVRVGLAAVAGVAAVSLVCHGFASLLAVAALIGASLGLLTVSVAAALPEIVPPRSMGLAAGLATGTAYLVSNLPVLFEGDPALRALFPAALALIALLFAPPLHSNVPDLWRRVPPPNFLRLLLTFLVLIWLDSAAFAIVQANPELKAQTWGNAAQKLLQGGVHFAAAAGAGALLDAGLGIAVPLAAWALFAIAFPLLQHGGESAVLAGPLYAIGISFYSVALVVAPTVNPSPPSPLPPPPPGRERGPGGEGLPPRWRAGLLFGIAGWLGSALGVGMAQDLGRIPGWFLGITGAVLAVSWFGAWLRPSRRVVRLFGPAVALGAAVVLIAAAVPQGPAAGADGSLAAEARGRRIYREEGCIHCHSQYVRAGTRDVIWWGPSRPLDRGERPPLVGTRRQGPDLREVGNRRGELWHELHLRDPRLLNPSSRMPSYAHLFEGDGERGRDLVAYLSSLGADTAVERWELNRAGAAAPAPARPSIQRGATLFAHWCAACHGPAGRGDGPLAARLSDPYADLGKPGFHSLPQGPGAEPEDRALARIIRHGLPPTSMPGHEWLTGQQIADLVAYVRTLPERSTDARR